MSAVLSGPTTTWEMIGETCLVNPWTQGIQPENVDKGIDAQAKYTK